MAKKHKKDPKEWIIKRKRNGREHIKGCKTGYRFKGQCQIHHIICIGCMQDSSIVKKVTREHMPFIRLCLQVTDWNINAANNNVGLPLTSVYFRRPNDPKWDTWPCHQVDHNPQYRDGISDYLYKTIWAKLIRDQKKCEFEGQKLAGDLEDASDNWRSFLEDRGIEEGGTRHCWTNRPGLKDAKGKPRGEQLENWYVPFSMDPGTPRKRKPPPEDEPASLKNLFKLL